MTQDRSDERDSKGNDDGNVDPDFPEGGETGGEDAPALAPEDLDITDSEYVEPLDEEGRYVVSPGDGPPNVPNSVTNDGTDEGGKDEGEDSRRGQSAPSDGIERSREPIRSPEAARTLLAEELGRSNARYGIDIVGRFGGNTVRHRTVSDDVIATFENLVRWYAGHVTDGTPADEVIEILLEEADLVETETPNLAKLLERHDLDRTDSIAALVTAIREESTHR